MKAIMKYSKLFVLLLTLPFLMGCSGNAAQPSAPDQPNAEEQKNLPAFELVEAYPQLTFKQPLEYVHAGDGSNRAFVVEKGGKIYVFDNDPQVTTANIFLDLSGKADSSSSEKGLLGLAFHPRFAQNGFFYVNYTARGSTIVARYQVNASRPDQGLLDSEEVLLTIAQPFSNHNGGHLAFGPDGYLYIGMGDGGSGGDPQGNAQNLNSLLGKMLRIDVDQAGAGKFYGIPEDNPLAGNNSGHREEIYAYGLRNPWKFSFDHNGRLWVADVGQNQVEEIDLVEKGLNYGWNIMEGSLSYNNSDPSRNEGLQLPVWEYRHSLGQSITGGYVYYGSQTPSLTGFYIYGDYVSGLIWALRLDAAAAPQNQLLLDSSLNISSFGLDKNNELYIIDLGGKIYKMQ